MIKELPKRIYLTYMHVNGHEFYTFRYRNLVLTIRVKNKYYVATIQNIRTHKMKVLGVFTNFQQFIDHMKKQGKIIVFTKYRMLIF